MATLHSLPRTSREKPAMIDRRARILSAATQRFALSGFSATTVRQIADDVDILSGSLYHHFATKEQILHEIVHDAAIQIRDNTLRIAQADVDAEQRLVALIMLDLGELTRNQMVYAILYNEKKLFRSSDEFAYILQAKKESFLGWQAVITDGMRDGLFDPALDIFLIFATIERMLNAAADWFRNDGDAVPDGAGPYDFEKISDFYLRFIMKAVRLSHRAAEPIPREACEELARFRV